MATSDNSRLALCFILAASACSVDDRALSVRRPALAADSAPDSNPRQAVPEAVDGGNGGADPGNVTASSRTDGVSCEPGSQRCTGVRVEGCSDAGQWEGVGISCSECVPHEAGCIGSTARVCSELGAWVGQICAGTEPLCVPETGSCACTPTSCAEGTICAATGRCEPPATDCPSTAPLAVGDLQDLAITRVRFDPDGSADVLLENVTPGYVGFAALAYALCNGANNCVYLSDTDSFGLMTGDTISRRIPNTLPSGGELAVVDLAPNFPLEPQVYVAWGEGAGADSFESMVNDVPPRNLQLWHTGERIVIEAGDNGFVCVGDVSLALGYRSCKP